MDKPKKTNRFFSSPSSNKKHLLKHSGSKDGGGMEVVAERSKKKEKVKGLSSIGSAAKENSQIGGSGDGEEELLLRTSATAAKRFKVHTKPLNDCNAIDLAVVPRKIRSAMIKRNRESLSPPLPEAKKPHGTPNGTQQSHLSSMQKAKQKMNQGVLGQLESIPITKDEEEVAETLFALARMIPNNKPVDCRVDKKNTEAKSPPVRQTTEISMLASEASKNESAKSLKEDISVEATNLPSSVEGSGSNAITVDFLTDTTTMHRPSIIRNQKFMLDRGIIGSLSDSRISQLQKNEHTDLTSLSVSATSGVLMNPCQTNRWIQGTQHKTSFCEQKTEMWQVAANLKKQEEHSMKENNDVDKRFASCTEGNNHNGTVLGLSLAGSQDREVAWSSKSNVPSWLNSAKHPDLAGDGVLIEKVNAGTVCKTQPWKKCATHVHISRLIQVRQASENKSMLPPIPNQMQPNGAKHGASASYSLNGLISLGDQSGLNRFISLDDCLNDGDAGKNMNDTRRTLQDKQNCDFLSLSTGGGSLGSAASFNVVFQRTNKLDSSAQFRVPYLHSVVQNPSLVPFSVHGRSSSPCPDQLAARATRQMKSEQMASPFYSPQHVVHTDSANQQQQQQQQMWAAHYMSGRNSTASYSSRWQHGKQDSPIYIPGECSQPPAHSSSTSFRHDVLSSKFPSNMQLQQQQLFSLSSSSSPSTSRGKIHHQYHHPHHLAGGYDGANGGSMLTARLT